MLEKIVINPKIIKRIIGRDNVSKLYIIYNPNSKVAYYRTDGMISKKPIPFNKVQDLSIYAS